MPEDEIWYNYYTKVQSPSVGVWHSAILSDLVQATFIRGGTILPILLHEECMALLTCMFNPIRLEIYLDENHEASGTLYVDDGETYRYQENSEYARVQFNFKDNLLTSQRISGTFALGIDQVVQEIAIYGL